MEKKLISIGIPCFNEELNIRNTYTQLCAVITKNKSYNYEFVFVDNGSIDDTKETIKKIAAKDKRVVGIFLSRNFGPEASCQAALDKASGDAFIFLECDLQDPPELILTFIDMWEKGYDLVVGIRTKIEDDFFMRTMRKLFYKIFRAISNIDVPVNSGTFGLIDRKVMN